MTTIRRAMLFAAGLGTRLQPLTAERPKPLIHVGGRPLIDYALQRFAAHGVERVVVNTHYQAEQVLAHLAQRRGGSTELCVSHEPELLETGGGVVHALPLLGKEPFFSANSDAFWLDGPVPALSRLSQAYDPARMDALLLLVRPENAVGYSGAGNFELARDGALVRCAAPRLIFSGLQVLHPRLLRGREETAFSLRELYAAAQGEDGRLARMYGLVHDAAWIHVGTPAELAEAERYLEATQNVTPSPKGDAEKV